MDDQPPAFLLILERRSAYGLESSNVCRTSARGEIQATVQALIDAVASVPGVWLLDHTMDHDHHRSVLTFAGAPDAMAEAAFRAIRIATDLIDLAEA